MKKLYSMLLALVMMFAFASTAMAADYPTTPGLYLKYDDTSYVRLNVTITGEESVSDLVARAFGDRAVWTDVPSTIGDGTGKVLKSLDGKGSVPYVSKVLEAYEFYDSSVDDPVLARVNAALLKAFPDSDGLGLWMNDGTGYSNEGPYMAYVGDDWTFTVNGSRPLDPNDSSVELYMNQTTIDAGDVIVLNYGETIEVWDYSK